MKGQVLVLILWMPVLSLNLIGTRHERCFSFQVSAYNFVLDKHCDKKNIVNFHKRGPLQTGGHPFPLLLAQPSSALLSTAQVGGPPPVQIGWATKTIIFEDVRGHKMTPVFTCKFFGQYPVQGNFFSPCLLVKII